MMTFMRLVLPFLVLMVLASPLWAANEAMPVQPLIDPATIDPAALEAPMDDEEQADIQWDDPNHPQTSEMPGQANLSARKSSDTEAHSNNAERSRAKQRWIDVDPDMRRTIVKSWLSLPEATRPAFPHFWKRWLSNQKPST
jgi:hypothetical protein